VGNWFEKEYSKSLFKLFSTSVATPRPELSLPMFHLKDDDNEGKVRSPAGDRLGVLWEITTLAALLGKSERKHALVPINLQGA
jgi:hypothetical protein